MTKSQGLALVVFSGGYDRVHYALAMAAAAAAVGRPVHVLVAGRALRLLLPDGGWQDLDPADDGSRPIDRDRDFAEKGIATLDELLEACGALGARFIACAMGLKALDLPPNVVLRDDLAITIGGIVGFLDGTDGGRTVFI